MARLFLGTDVDLLRTRVVCHCQGNRVMVEFGNVVENILYIAAAYLIGSVSFGYLAGRVNGIDLREHGSRNIGATNATRILGRKWGVTVFVLDFLKGYLPVLGVLQMQGWDVATYNAGQIGLLLGVIVALVLGHTYTCFLGFRGGKGVATMAGCLVGAFPMVAAWAVGTWLVMMAITRYVSLSSLIAGGVMVAASCYYYGKNDGVSMPAEWMIPGVLFLILLLVIYRHRENLRRIANGTEPKAFSKKK